MYYISKAQAKAVLLFVAKGDIRHYLNDAVVLMMPSGVSLVATDGHRAVAVTLTPFGDEPNKSWPEGFACKVSVDVLQVAAKDSLGCAISAEKGEIGFDVSIKVAGRMTTWVQEETVNYPDVAGVMPDIPNDDRMLSLSYFNPEYAVDATKAARLLSGAKYKLGAPFQASLRDFNERLLTAVATAYPEAVSAQDAASVLSHVAQRELPSLVTTASIGQSGTIFGNGWRIVVMSCDPTKCGVS